MDKDSQYMEQVLHIERKGIGYTSPNPVVGAILVKKDRIIGKGYHRQYGQKHAEVDAMDILADLRITSLLVEGGAKVFTQFIEQGLFDKISFFIAPIIVGKGIEAIGGLDTIKLSQTIRLENPVVETVEDQVIMHGYRDLRSTFGRMAEVKQCLPAL